MFWYFFLALIVVAIIGFMIGRAKALTAAGSNISSLHSRPAYHGGYVAILAAIPALIVLVLWTAFSGNIIAGMVAGSVEHLTDGLSDIEINALLRDARTLALGGAVSLVNEAKQSAADIYSSILQTSNIMLGVILAALAGAGLYYGSSHITAERRTRHFVERAVMIMLIACSAVAILTTIGIVLSLIFESYRFFLKINFFDFLFGIHWSPQTALRADQVAAAGEFGAIPLFVGTLLITAIAIAVAAPIGLMAAIFLSDYASLRFRSIAKPILEILAVHSDGGLRFLRRAHGGPVLCPIGRCGRSDDFL